MSADIQCPYCKADQEICHDDGMGYDEEVMHDQECSKCEKVFGFHTSIIYYYEPFQVCCFNGEDHKWKSSPTIPPYYPDRKMCTECGTVEQGKIDMVLVNKDREARA